jgi:uncharacterized repeat protein (TIGR03803 family)
MPSQAQHPTCVFRTILLVGLTALLMPLVVLPMPAQTSVPATASEAAKMPQFASRLHPAARPPSRPDPAVARRGSRGGSPQGGIVYENGPIDGTTYAWTINFGFVVSDSFTVTAATNVDGMTFGAWLFPGDVLQTAEISITSERNGGTSYFDQIVNFTASGCVTNNLGYNVCTETGEGFNTPTLQPGTYWVSLWNALVNNGDPVFWDQNNGVGCSSPGCPSLASSNDVGTIPSESFAMLGDNGNQPPPCFRSQGNLQIIHDFTQQQQEGFPPSGVTIDRAGNLYGTTPYSGSNGAGYVFKLAQSAGWLLDPLFNFSGGNNGGQPSGVIVGPNGSLYGGAQGGIQNCGTDGSQYCGLVFNLRPGPTTCATSQCSWNENAPYRFSRESDGSGTINVNATDQRGNLYGTTTTGGAFDQGTVFELTPAGTGWTKTTLYTFTGGTDGSSPTQVLVGNDGRLYGIATGGGGAVFQLTSSGGHWTESVIHDFSDEQDEEAAYLVQDSAGNLYGISNSFFQGAIFTLQKNGSVWAFDEFIVQHEEFDDLNNLAIDVAGSLYGTGVGNIQDEPFAYVTYIFKASYNASQGWAYADINYLGQQEFFAGGPLALDSSGNLYGTTSTCGANGYGTVWQLSP